jgi:outer membrane lipoprotein-sorting protein
MRRNRNWMVWTSMFLAVFVAGLVSASAQDAAPPAPAASLPTVDQIIDKYVSAIGGEAAIRKVTSRVAKGSFSMEQMPGEGTIEVDQKAPNKMYSDVESSAMGSFKRGFDGETAWQDTPQTGVADITGSQLADMQRSADFYGELDLKQLYPKMSVKGEEDVDGHKAWVITAESKDGSSSSWYFDEDSGLKVRDVSQAQGPEGSVEVDTTLGDYRDVDGVKIPCMVHESLGEVAFTIKLTDIKQNVPIDDAKFAKPAAK